MATNPLKVLIRTPLNEYSGYGKDGCGIARALMRWGCDVYIEPTYVSPPLTEDIAHLLTKHLQAPFDLFIHHCDPDGLSITQAARDCSEVTVAWSMWEFCLHSVTEVFTQRGWLHWSEIRSGDRTLGINIATGLAEWQDIESVNVFEGARDMTAWDYNGFSAQATDEHRWLVRDSKDRWQWRTTTTLRRHDRVPRAAVLQDLPAEAKYSDALVELVAWFYTEGWLERGRQIRIGQNVRVSPEKTERIRAALGQVFRRVSRNSPHPGDLTWSEGYKPDGMVHFNLSQAASDVVTAAAPSKTPSFEFLQSLTRAQLELFIDVSCWADGWDVSSGGRGFGQALGSRMEAFIYACVLAGKVVGAPSRNSTHQHLGSVQVRSLGGRYTSPETTARTHLGTKRTVHHEGIVWCPTVPLGNWLARDNGHIFYTGNSKPKPLALHPSTFKRRIGMFDLALMYDQVGLDAWKPYGPKRQHWGVLQGGYESSEWKKFDDRDWFGDRFMFIQHGQLHARKAPYVTIQAFNELKHEHKDFESARLGLHTTIGDPLVVFGNLIPGMKVWHEMWEKPTLEDFYHAAHVLVAPSRGEGKNLPALEMMTTGGAVAATDWGGHQQWLNPEYAYPLGYELTPTEASSPNGALDAKVSVETMKEFMWHAFTHRDEVKQKAELAANMIPKLCDWDVVIENFFRRVRDEVPGKGEVLWNKAQQVRQK